MMSNQLPPSSTHLSPPPSHHPLEILVVDVYYRIREFLSHLEYISLMNTSQKIFSFIKHETIYFSLNQTFSSQYLLLHSFRSNLQQLVKTTNQQIGLILRDYMEYAANPSLIGGENNHNNLRKLTIFNCRSADSNGKIPMNQFKGISFLLLRRNELTTHLDDFPEMIKVHFRHFTRLENLEGLRGGKVKRLQLAHCPAVKDMSSLSQLIKLELNDCASVKDVSCLGKVRYLTINSCHLIEDISALSDVYDLKILNCREIDLMRYHSNNYKFKLTEYLRGNIDYGFTFQKVKHLSLLGCANFYEFKFKAVVRLEVEVILLAFIYYNRFVYFNSDLSLNEHLQELILIGRSARIDCSTFHRLHSLALIDCSNLKDVSLLGSIHTLSLQGCPRLKHLNGLGRGNQRVTITNCSELQNFSGLKSVPRVTIINCPGFKSCTEVSQVKELTLSKLSFSPNFHELEDVQFLSLDECEDVRSVEGLEKIPTLCISNCKNLYSINGLGMDPRQRKIVLSRVEHNINLCDRTMLLQNYSREEMGENIIYLRKRMDG